MSPHPRTRWSCLHLFDTVGEHFYWALTHYSQTTQAVESEGLTTMAERIALLALFWRPKRLQ